MTGMEETDDGKIAVYRGGRGAGRGHAAEGADEAVRGATDGGGPGGAQVPVTMRRRIFGRPVARWLAIRHGMWRSVLRAAFSRLA